MGLLVLRCFYILLASGIGVMAIRADAVPIPFAENPVLTFFGILGVSILLIVADIIIPRKRVDWISAVYFGILIGLILTYALNIAIAPMFPVNEGGVSLWHQVITIILAVNICYLCISFLLQTRNDFRFVIPYVEFQKNVKGSRPFIMDTSVIIDGRIADVVDTLIIDNRLIIPSFVVAELQRVADSSDRNRRTRGRRGLDVLNRLQTMPNIEVELDETDLIEMKGQPVDMKLIILTKHMEGKLLTNDYNLNKVAKVQGVEVINLNDLANVMKPIFLPGERLEVDVIKTGDEIGQGIGYLDDGTMVVIEGGRNHIAERIAVTVTSVLQNSAGRMIFGRFEYTAKKLASAPVALNELASGNLTKRMHS
ncbi:MAG: TRAM domain-containing protein [Planctomycetaceae bacterium]|nr:TRAM domain-containing protein [Planctomycetaceae bacterium]